MIEGIQRLRKDLKLVLAGFQEATVTVADHVSSHVKTVKTTMDARALEEQIKKERAILGRKVYEQADTSIDTLYKENKIRERVTFIEELQEKLETIEGSVSPLEALQDFERLLIRSKFAIQQVIVPEDFHGNGKTIRQLAFPSQMLIFFIRKKGETEIAQGETVISARDEITFLCDKENTSKYRMFWRNT
ncbi:MAG: TrkA C-terminal domain-containing protein [Nitrospiria bacterium]